jgi:aspartyl-tRNA(Asn)/glutamyl-tRNA(Gln) amidotransferase subunit A
VHPSLSYSTIRQQLENGTLTCVERVQFHLQQIQQQENLNAFLDVYAQEALRRAAQIDLKISNQTAGKLAGMVVGIKDVFAHEGHPLQAGSRILDNFQSLYNATAVQRLLDEDAIIIGRQNCDEFAMGSSNENSAFGPVLHPTHPDRVPGGSSGGSAVAVAANLCQVSLGSDTGGSVRQPAAFCGVVGLKPTYSRISRWGLVAYASSFDCVGIFSKSTEDVALVLEVIAGADELDSTVSRRPVEAYTNLSSFSQQKFRIAYLEEPMQSGSLQPEIKQNLEQKIDALKLAGHSVQPIAFPSLKYVLPTYYILVTAEASSNLSRYDGVRYGARAIDASDLASLYKKSRAQGFGKEVQRRILLGTFVLSARYYDAYYTKAQKVRRLIRDETKKIFQDFDFMLMPTAPTTAFQLGALTSDPVQMYLADLFSVHANVAGVPAVAVPTGVDGSGLPIGLQIVGDDFQEAKLLTVANILMHL